MTNFVWIQSTMWNPHYKKVFPMRTFWENERPSSSDDESEIESCLTSEREDLHLSRNYLKSEVHMLEHKIKKFQTYLRNQKTTNRQLKTENEVIKNQKNELENELESLKLVYKNDQTNFKNQELTNTRLIKENETLVHLNNELENELQSLEERFNELANCELFFDTVSNFVEFDAI